MLSEEGVCYDQYVFLAKLLSAFALLYFVLQAKPACLAIPGPGCGIRDLSSLARDETQAPCIGSMES